MDNRWGLRAKGNLASTATPLQANPPLPQKRAMGDGVAALRWALPQNRPRRGGLGGGVGASWIHPAQWFHSHGIFFMST